MKKAITASAILFAALIAYATMTGDLNTWLGYMAGEDATGERTTVQGAGAGGGASYLYRTELIGAASGVYGYWFQDTVGIGYRALRHSSYMTNVIAIGSHALEGVQGMGTMADVTWIGGHFVANPPNPDPTMGLSQVPGEFYITGDASKTNSLAPIWYDGSNLWLNAEQIVTPSGSISGGGEGIGPIEISKWLLTRPDGSMAWLESSEANIWSWGGTVLSGDYMGASWTLTVSGQEYTSAGDLNATALTFGSGNTVYRLVRGNRLALDTDLDSKIGTGGGSITGTLTINAGMEGNGLIVTSGEGVLQIGPGALHTVSMYYKKNLAADERAYDFPDKSGTFALTNDVPTLAGKTFDLSTDAGLREAVSNIVITLGGTVVN